FITVSEPPIADPHDGWCGGCRRETCGYPIPSKIVSYDTLLVSYNLKCAIVSQNLSYSFLLR
ncbi:MAG: hypothetical protein KZQ57_04735, partial [gamma proteobacterium symbiont of Lucinoma myriamae]|nr:hypothetical protein [gamma proteobacterium symbiont of Lucinoma myriamae]